MLVERGNAHVRQLGQLFDPHGLREIGAQPGHCLRDSKHTGVRQAKYLRKHRPWRWPRSWRHPGSWNGHSPGGKSAERASFCASKSAIRLRAQSPVLFSSSSGYRAPWIVIFEAVVLISPKSSDVSSTAAAPMFSSRRSSFRVPGIGTIHGKKNRNLSGKSSFHRSRVFPPHVGCSEAERGRSLAAQLFSLTVEMEELSMESLKSHSPFVLAILAVLLAALLGGCGAREAETTTETTMGTTTGTPRPPTRGPMPAAQW